MLVQVLSNHHCLRHRKAQFAGSLLLQCRSGEGRCGCTLQWFLVDRLNGVGRVNTFLQELLHLFVGLQTLCERSLYLCLRTVGIGDGKDAGNTIVCLALEILYLTFALYDEAYGNALYTSGRQGGFNLAP